MSHAVRAGTVIARRSACMGGGGGGSGAHVLPRAAGGGILDGSQSQSPRENATPPTPPSPARAERHAITWPALTACDTYTG